MIAEIRLIELVSQFPTVIPTAALIFCLVWWMVSLFVSGLDADPDSLAHGRGPSRARAATEEGGARRTARGRVRRTRRVGGGRRRGGLRLDVLPLSLAVTVLSFGAWAVSLLGALLLDGAGLDGVARVLAGLALLGVSTLAGLGLVRLFAIPAEKVFVTHTAPKNGDAVGATCRIRSVRGDRGDAQMLTGPTAGTIVSIELAPGSVLAAGDDALVVSYDEGDARFVVMELDDLLRGS